MNATKYLFITLAAAGGIYALSASAQTTAKQPTALVVPKDPTTLAVEALLKPRKWEYQVKQNADQKQMNQMGQENWELVAVTAGTANGNTLTTVTYWKRPAVN
jgi:hypothetical protein